MSKAPLIILSGPSGCGKSTVIARLLRSAAELPLRLSVSATTRPSRQGEIDGVDYHFWTREQFDREVAAGAFLEWAEAYGNCYGTLKAEVEPFLDRGVGVILDIETRGAAQVKRLHPDVIRVLLRAPSMAVYERRLRERHSENEQSLQRRLGGAQQEIDRALAAGYEHTIINDDLEIAVAQFRDIIRQQFQRTNSHAR